MTKAGFPIDLAGEGLARAASLAADLIERRLAGRFGPSSSLSPRDIASLVQDVLMPEPQGIGLERALESYGALLLDHAVNPSHPAAIAHLHCPVALPALSAELIVSAVNQSMDSWDQSSVATALEERFIRWLAAAIGLPEGADGVFTSGGTASNQMGLQLALEHKAREFFDCSPLEVGIKGPLTKLRILTSEHAHFSVEKAAATCGLGRQSVVRVKADIETGMNPRALEEAILELKRQDLVPFLVVATCGTTDFGSIDPTAEIERVARRHGAWLHVDAAYGGALVFSKTRRSLLYGLELADSLAIDFHKMWLQPISCAAFLLRDGTRFSLWEQDYDYLDREADRARGMVNLVSKSLQTSRRFDALKVMTTLRAYGTDTFGSLVDQMCERARELADMLADDPDFEVLTAAPVLSTVLFRLRSARGDEDRLQQEIRHRLFERGRAVLGQTVVAGRTWLKATLLNPALDTDGIRALIDAIKKERGEDRR